MLFLQGITRTDRTSYPVKTVIRHMDSGFTLISLLLKTDTAHTSYFSVAVAAFADNPSEGDCRLCENVTGDAEKAEELFRLITEGSVTPCTLTDVLEDLL